MPELPEVETVRRDVAALFTGRTILDVTVGGPRTLRRHADPAAAVARLAGRRLERADRRGKFLLLRLDSGDVAVVHLGMSGQLRVAQPGQARPPHTHLVLSWESGPELRFVDPRTFGQVWVSAPLPAAPTVVPELAHLGFEPLDDPIGWRGLERRLAGRRTKLKPLLMDQRFVAGIGNIYSDEILWSAGVAHDRAAGSLEEPEVRALYRSMRSVLQAAVRLRGSSLADEQYRDLAGRIGGYQLRHRVYGREGLPCGRCGAAILRAKAYGRSTWYCPDCQR